MHPEGEYKVVYSENVRENLKDLCRRAQDAGLGKEILAAIKTIDRELHDAPKDFGDPLYTLPNARLTVYRRLLAPLDVFYSVHKIKPIVFVRDFEPFPADAF